MSERGLREIALRVRQIGETLGNSSGIEHTLPAGSAGKTGKELVEQAKGIEEVMERVTKLLSELEQLRRKEYDYLSSRRQSAMFTVSALRIGIYLCCELGVDQQKVFPSVPETESSRQS